MAKLIFLGGVAALIAATLFPPWHIERSAGIAFTGFHPLFDPPEYEGYVVSLDTAFLLKEWVAIAVVTAALGFVFRERREAA